MFKTSVLAAFLAIAALSPAYAAQDLCNDAHMKQMDDMIAKMTDAAKKEGGEDGSRYVQGRHEEG
jgi:hypothetical protein